MTKKNWALVLLLAAATIVGTSYAEDPPPFDPNSPDSIPVDGASGVLLAGGIMMGVRKLRARRAA